MSIEWNPDPKSDLGKIKKLYESGCRDVEKIARRLKLPINIVRRQLVMVEVMLDK